MYLRVLPLPHFSSKVARIPIPSSRLGVPVKTYLYSLLVEQVTMARLCCSDEKRSRSISCRSKLTSNHGHVYACLLNVDFTRRSNVEVLSLSKRITGKRLLDKLNVGSTGRRGWSQSDAVHKLSDRVISHHEDCLVLRRLWLQISRAENFSLDRNKELSWPYVPILHPLLLFRTLRSISVPNTGRVVASTRDKDLGNEFFLFLSDHILESWLGLVWRGSMWRVSRPMRSTECQTDRVLFAIAASLLIRGRTWSGSTLQAERMLITVDIFDDARVAFALRPVYFHALYFHALEILRTRMASGWIVASIDQ